MNLEAPFKVSPEIPDHIKALYKTIWEISQKDLIDMAADRGAFIDQSQSLNLFLKTPDFGKMTSMHFHTWKMGLKTGMYYLRTQAAAQAIQFTVDKQQSLTKQKTNEDELVLKPNYEFNDEINLKDQPPKPKIEVPISDTGNINFDKDIPHDTSPTDQTTDKLSSIDYVPEMVCSVQPGASAENCISCGS